MKLSDTEWIVMRALWAHAPATAREVLDRVTDATGWAYTTVKTILARLVEKGAVASERRANTDWFRPAITRRQATRTALRALLDRAFDGTLGALVHHLAREERLTRKDREQLRLALRELEDEDRS